MKAKLTVELIKSQPFQSSGDPLIIRDGLVKGFALKVNKASKVFVIEKRIKGKLKKETIGEFPAMTLEYARKKAQLIISNLMMGLEPVQLKRARQKGITLGQVIKDYFEVSKLKESTKKVNAYIIHRHLKDWINCSIFDITGKMVLKKHGLITKEKGPAAANNAMRKLRAVLNFSETMYDEQFDFTAWKNPVRKLTELKAWNPSRRRSRVIHREKLGTWFNVVLELRESSSLETEIVTCDLIIFLLLTGLRKNEATKLTWDEVFRFDNYIVIPSSRAKNSQEHRLPLTDYLFELIEKRWRQRVNNYIFPSHNIRNKDGHLKDPNVIINKISKRCGIERLSAHDLRRTFSSLAESLDFNTYTIKKLLNHAIDQDVTGGYISKYFDADRLRKPMQEITDYILDQAGVASKRSRKIEVFLNDQQLSWFQQQAEKTGESMCTIATKLIANSLAA